MPLQTFGLQLRPLAAAGGLLILIVEQCYFPQMIKIDERKENKACKKPVVAL